MTRKIDSPSSDKKISVELDFYKINKETFDSFIEYLESQRITLANVIEELILDLIISKEKYKVGYTSKETEELAKKWFETGVLREWYQQHYKEFIGPDMPFNPKFHQVIMDVLRKMRGR